MYLEYFGLDEAPFSITPDPAFVYLSDRHRDALAHLLFGVGQGGSGGFVQLTGEVGTGKTTLCRCMLEQVSEDTRIALVLNPVLTPLELLSAICEELGLPVGNAPLSAKELVDRLNHYLLQAHREELRVVVVIDEAQNLSPAALEQVRLLTNLETSKEKLLQIVLLGQPELREMLQRRDLRQLAQRITARYHLTPLDARDTAEYVQHRLRVAGARYNPFRRSAVKALFQRSHGVPRLINIIADRALVGAYAQERQYIGARMVHAAADEVQLGEPGARRSWWPWVSATAALALLAAVIVVTVPTGKPLAPDEPDADASPRTGVPDGAVAASRPSGQVAAEQAEIRPPPTTLPPEWLETQSAAAWRGLAEAWGDPGDAWSVQAACEGVAGTGYACVSSLGNWARIRQLGWPVVLVLAGPPERFLLLRGVNDREVLVGAGEEALTVSRETIEERWLGRYFSAWPQSPDWPGEIRRGDTGPAVQTVLELAGRADPPLREAESFDQRTERWMMDFQRRHGLEMDGIVGPRTLQYLLRPAVERPVLLDRWTRSP